MKWNTSWWCQKKKKSIKEINFLPYVPCTHIAVEGKTQLKLPYLTSMVHGLLSTLMEFEGNFLSKKTKALKKSLSFEERKWPSPKKGEKKNSLKEASTWSALKMEWIEDCGCGGRSVVSFLLIKVSRMQNMICFNPVLSFS